MKIESMKKTNIARGCIAMIVSGITLFGSATPTHAGDFEIPLTPAQTPGEDDWKFTMGLNLWGPDMTATTSSGATVDLGVDDIFSDLKMALMASVAAEKGRWFIGTDIVYLDLEQSLSGRSGLRTYSSDVELSGLIMTPMVGYNVGEGDWGRFDIMAGARYLYLDVDASLTETVPILGTTTTATSESGHDWAAVVGFKGHYNLSGNWYVPFYFDIGAGDPDLTLQAFLGVGYRAKYCDLLLGYRYLKFDLGSGSALTELEAKGPMMGVYFSF